FWYSSAPDLPDRYQRTSATRTRESARCAASHAGSTRGEVSVTAPPGTEERRLLLLGGAVQVLGQVAEDDLVEGLLADQVLAEDRCALLRARGGEDGGRTRRGVAAG